MSGNKMTRRQFASMNLFAVAGMAFPFDWKAPKKMTIGIQSYSFRDRDLDEAISAMRQLGVTSCELWSGHVEPREFKWERGQTAEVAKQKREGLKKWRDNLSMTEIEKIRDKFKNAGITIQAYNGAIKDQTTDEEIKQIFDIAKTLDTDLMTTSATVSVMKRVNEVAVKYNIRVGMHNHDNVKDPNEFATPESFEKGMAGNSDLIGINLDIGHFTAANYDPVEYMKKHHEKIYSIHLKDRKKDHGIRTPFGEGDTPVAEVLKLIRDNQWPIAANIEYEYDAADAVAEVKRNLEYCQKVINSK